MGLDERTFQHLVTLYKNKGVSLDNVLSDATFKALPLEKKIEIVKKYSNELHDGMHFDKDDVKNLLKALGLGVLGAIAFKGGYDNLKMMHEDGASAWQGLAAMGGAATALVSGGHALYDEYENYSRKQLVKDYLRHITTNPNEGTAVRLLSVGGENKC